MNFFHFNLRSIRAISGDNLSLEMFDIDIFGGKSLGMLLIEVIQRRTPLNYVGVQLDFPMTPRGFGKFPFV